MNFKEMAPYVKKFLFSLSSKDVLGDTASPIVKPMILRFRNDIVQKLLDFPCSVDSVRANVKEYSKSRELSVLFRQVNIKKLYKDVKTFDYDMQDKDAMSFKAISILLYLILIYYVLSLCIINEEGDSITSITLDSRIQSKLIGFSRIVLLEDNDLQGKIDLSPEIQTEVGSGLKLLFKYIFEAGITK